MTTPMFPYAEWEAGTNQNSIPANDNSLRSEIIAKAALGFAATEPGSPAQGGVYVVGAPWGPFSTNDVVTYRSGTWYGFAPFEGWLKWIAGAYWKYSTSEGWVEQTFGGGSSRDAVTALSIVSGAVNIDCALGDYFTLALTANVTGITFSNLPAAGKGASLMLRITQDSTARTVAWPTSFRWEGAAPAVSTGSGAVDVLALTSFDQGTKWDATLSKGRV